MRGQVWEPLPSTELYLVLCPQQRLKNLFSNCINEPLLITWLPHHSWEWERIAVFSRYWINQPYKSSKNRQEQLICSFREWVFVITGLLFFCMLFFFFCCQTNILCSQSSKTSLKLLWQKMLFQGGNRVSRPLFLPIDHSGILSSKQTDDSPVWTLVVQHAKAARHSPKLLFWT